MRKIFSFSIFIKLLKIVVIANEIKLRQNQEEDIFDFLNVSNIKCNQTNYITSFAMKICGETEIKRSQYFAYTFFDTKNYNHSVECSIIINNKKRTLNSYKDNTNNIGENYSDNEVIDNYDSDLKETANYNSDFETSNNHSSDININDADVEVIDNYDSDIKVNDSFIEKTDINIFDTDNTNSDAILTNIEVSNNIFNSDSVGTASNTVVTYNFDSSAENIDNYKSDIHANNASNLYSDFEITEIYDNKTMINDNNVSIIESDSEESKNNDGMTDYNTDSINQKDTVKLSDLNINEVLSSSITDEFSKNNINITISEMTTSIDSNEFNEIENITQIDIITKTEIDISTIETEKTNYITDHETIIPKTEQEIIIRTTELETAKIESEKVTHINDLDTNISNALTETISQKTELEPTINSTIIESTIPTTKIEINNISSTFVTSSTYSSIKTTIIEKETIQEFIYPINQDYDFCYEAICTFNGMIREEFEVKIENDFPIYIDEIPENIFIQPLLFETTSYKVSKCYLIKNKFKQVLKYKIHESEKKISFCFISIILEKVSKNEEIFVDVLLKKKTKILRNLNNLEEKTALCKSNYNVVPVERKEIFNSYNCEINDIEKPGDYSGLIFSSSSDVKNIPNDTNSTDPSITDALIKEGKIQDFSLLVFNLISIDINNCHNTSRFTLLGNLHQQVDEALYFGLMLFLEHDKNATVNCSLPNGISGDINITCNVLDYFYNSSLYIPNQIIVDIKSNEPFLNITEFNYEGKTTCELINEITNSIINDSEYATEYLYIPETDKISKEINSDIIFRQISHLEINSSGKTIKFNIIGFTFNSLEKDSFILICTNLIKLNNAKNDLINATCTLTNDAKESL